jgi:hypothetical protein
LRQTPEYDLQGGHSLSTTTGTRLLT